MEHMTKGDRGRIELLVSVGRSVPQVAAELGRSPSTIRRELLEHRVGSSKGYGRANALCAHYAECALPSFSATGRGLRRNEPKCFRTCPDFREAVCHGLAKPPFVCNGCADERKCPLPKKANEVKKGKLLGRATPDEETVAQAKHYRESLPRRPGWRSEAVTYVVEVCSRRGYNWFEIA